MADLLHIYTYIDYIIGFGWDDKVVVYEILNNSKFKSV